MSVPRSVAGVLDEHVTLEVEGIDRMYLMRLTPKEDRTRTSDMLCRSEERRWQMSLDTPCLAWHVFIKGFRLRADLDAVDLLRATARDASRNGMLAPPHRND
jgi:hypothetical protein